MTTLAALIRSYLDDSESPYQALEYITAGNYRRNCRRLATDHGAIPLSDVRARDLKRWHAEWSAGSGVSMAHALVSMLRIVTGYGATLWEDEAGNKACSDIRGWLTTMRFAMGGRRTTYITFEQALAVYGQALKRGYESVALAQAFQFESLLRQKDVIGAWVPIPCERLEEMAARKAMAVKSEEGLVGCRWADNGERLWVTQKGGTLTKIWIKGLRWENVDANCILTHVTSKKKKTVTADLTLLPLVREALERQFFDFAVDTVDASGKVVRAYDRAALPTSGPIIVSEVTYLPWTDYDYRRTWRELAREVGIPDHVQNRDSRAGGITEATNAGADLETVRRAATHSNIATTQIYSRDNGEATARMMEFRVASRQNGAGHGT